MGPGCNCSIKNTEVSVNTKSVPAIQYGPGWNTSVLLVVRVTWEAQSAGEADGGREERHRDVGGDRHRVDGAPPHRGPQQVPGLRSERESERVVPDLLLTVGLCDVGGGQGGVPGQLEGGEGEDLVNVTGQLELIAQQAVVEMGPGPGV